MSRSRTEPGSFMGLYVGESCIGAAVAGALWNGHWRHPRTRHEEAFPASADHVQRAAGGRRAARDLAQWARSQGVARACIEEPRPEPCELSRAELSALLVAELIRAEIDVVAAGLGGTLPAPYIVRQSLLDEGAPEGLCTVEYVALAMLGVARQQHEAAKADQLHRARASMPDAIASILGGLAR